MAQNYEQMKAHKLRDDLTGEHTVGDAGQILLACLFMATWIADTFFFNYTTFLNQYMPLGVRIPSGVVLLVLSGYLARTGLSIVFGEERDKPGVINESVFNIALSWFSDDEHIDGCYIGVGYCYRIFASNLALRRKAVA